MPVSSQSQHTPRTLFLEAEDPLTPEPMRFIALGQIVEKLRDRDPSPVHYESNVDIAQRAIRLVADLLATPASGALLNAATGQLTRRLKPDHGAFGLSSEVQLTAAETAAAQAIRPEVDADKALKPLIHLLNNVLPAASVIEISRYADAAELLMVCANRSDELQVQAAGIAFPLITHPLLDADDRLGRLTNVLIRTPDLPPIGRADFVQAFSDTVKELYGIDPAYAKECLDYQENRFEEAQRPELIADAVLPAKALIINLARAAENLEPKNLVGADMLLSNLVNRDRSNSLDASTPSF